MAKRLTAKVINKIRALHRDGLTGFAIAKRVKKSRPSIYKVIHSLKGAAPKKHASSSNGAKLQTAIHTVVEREVRVRLKQIRERVLKAFSV